MTCNRAGTHEMHLRTPNEGFVPFASFADLKKGACVMLALDARPVLSILAHGQPRPQPLLQGANVRNWACLVY